MTTCNHLDQMRDVIPQANGCVDCLAVGDTWIHLRLCVTCGYVGCCNSSKNKHASAHARSSNHPIVESFEPGEDWFWCYVDEVAFVVDNAPTLSYSPGNHEEVGRVI
jgi:hypothetical protein